MVSDERYDTKQKVHWVFKPLLLSLSYMIRTFDDDAFQPKTAYAQKLSDAMDRAIKRISNSDDPEHPYNKLLNVSKQFAIALANVERVWFMVWVDIFHEEFTKEGIFGSSQHGNKHN